MSDDHYPELITQRKSRLEKARGWFARAFGWILKRGWIEVEAEVLECVKPARNPIHRAPYYDETQFLAGENLITFAYIVDGRTYSGILSSRVEVEKGDKFLIKVNPRNPEQNNSIDSESNWTVEYTKLLDVFLILLFTVLFIRYLIENR